MKIWSFNATDNSYVLNYDIEKAKQENHPIYSDFDGTIKKDNWTSIELRTVKKGKGKDFLCLESGVPLFSALACERLDPFLADQVEFLSVNHSEFDLRLINVTNIIDCADKERSIANTLSSGAFIDYRKTVFIPEKIPHDTLIFKLPETRRWTKLYVTDKFIELAAHHQLEGLGYIELWDSEFTEEMEQAKQRKYQEKLDSIDKNKGPEFSYEDAIKKVDSGLGVASGKWKMQRDVEGRLWLGQIGDDEEYHWLMPVYIPPVLLGYLWHEVDRSEL